MITYRRERAGGSASDNMGTHHSSRTPGSTKSVAYDELGIEWFRTWLGRAAALPVPSPYRGGAGPVLDSKSPNAAE